MQTPAPGEHWAAKVVQVMGQFNCTHSLHWQEVPPQKACALSVMVIE